VASLPPLLSRNGKFQGAFLRHLAVLHAGHGDDPFARDAPVKP
jgi:hypothetical protein